MKLIILLLGALIVGCTSSGVDNEKETHNASCKSCPICLASEAAIDGGIDLSLYFVKKVTYRSDSVVIFFTGKEHIPGRHFVAIVRKNKIVEILPGA